MSKSSVSQDKVVVLPEPDDPELERVAERLRSFRDRHPFIEEWDLDAFHELVKLNRDWGFEY